MEIVDSLAFWDCARECHYEFGVSSTDRVVTIDVLPESGSMVPEMSYLFDETNAPSFPQVMLRLEFFLPGPYASRPMKQPRNVDHPTAPHIQQQALRQQADVRVTQTAKPKQPCKGC